MTEHQDAVEIARGLLVARLRKIGKHEPRSGFSEMADDLAEGHLMQIQTWIALDVLAESLTKRRAILTSQAGDA